MVRSRTQLRLRMVVLLALLLPLIGLCSASSVAASPLSSNTGQSETTRDGTLRTNDSRRQQPSIHKAGMHAGASRSPLAVPWAAMNSMGLTLVSSVEKLVDAILPLDLAHIPFDGDVDTNEDHMEGGLFGDGTTLAWGGSMLEVVKTQASYLTRPAAFGPRIVDEKGLRGQLQIIGEYHQTKESDDPSHKVDNHGCPHVGGPGWRDDDGQNGSIQQQDEAPASKAPANWIALIERGGNCSFVAKVRVAQALGAMAVVIGDEASRGHEHDGPLDNDTGLSGQLVTMYAPGDTSDVHIPSTFITRPSYVDLIRLIDEQAHDTRDDCIQRKKNGEACPHSKDGLEVILWRDDIVWEWPLIDLAFVLLMLPSFMTLATIVIHRIRMVRQRRRERAPELAVLNLPCLVWRGNGQPWEKVEDAQIVETGQDDDVRRNRFDMHTLVTRAKTMLNRFRNGDARRDMELGASGGAVESEATPAGLYRDDPTSTQDEAGPSTLTRTASLRPLKTTPVAPPQPPPDRTYYSCDECSICLSDFVDGDLVRVLPCGHVFHLSEIDSWLIKVKKFCPICKRDITVPVPPLGTTNPANGNGIPSTAIAGVAMVDGPAETTAAAGTIDERAPLLANPSRLDTD